MPELITSNEQLRSIIPNQLVTVKGEISLFDKLVPYLEQSEQWLFSQFVPEYLTEYVYDISTQIVAIDAYRRAIPQLDLIITPNGFATVGSTNLSPASKMRVDRLVNGLLTERDKLLGQLLKELPYIDDWNDSPQGQWFGATLFPNFDLCGQIGETEHLWDKYCELRPQIVDLEASLADEWFSPELMSALRADNLASDLTEKRGIIARQIKAQILGFLRVGSFNSRRLADIVNYIRQSENDFPEWHQSATAALFAPPVFRNDKKAKGYFF